MANPAAVEGGCTQIYLERWVASRADGPSVIAAIGIGRQDVEQRAVVEKKIHVIAFELPKRGDYLDVTTNSLSPFGKIILGGTILLVGCTDDEPPPPAPITAAFQPPPNPEETPEPPIPLGQSVKKGRWDVATAQIDLQQELGLTWKSYLQGLTSTGAAEPERGIPNSPVQIWLTNTDRMAITRLEPNIP